MGLFSTLLESSAPTVDPAEESASSLSLPTVIQMYTTTEPYRLEKATKIPSYGHLSFQAVALGNEEDTEEKGLRAKPKAEHVPELGVWNCRVHTPASQNHALSDSILSIATKTAATAFCFHVDLGQPASVEPTLAALQDALVRHLIQTSTEEKTPAPSETATTSLYQLREVQFGLAPEDKDTAKTTTAAPSEADRQVKVALQICVAWPASSKNESDDAEDDDHARQQTIALLFYHLRRYAAALQASLAFVRTNALPATDAQQQPTLSLPQLSLVWKALAQGKPVWRPAVLSEVLEKEDEHFHQESSSNDTGHALIYGPDDPHPEVIESALLRNASYPGHWDATQESVWKILPAAPTTTTTPQSTSTSDTRTAVGDEAWLKELRDSVALPATAATPSKPITTAESKTPDVSDYFAQFLGK